MPAPEFHQTQPALSPEVAAAAATWIARRDAGLTPTQAQEFTVWYNGDPRHRAALARLDGVWRTLDRPLAAGVADAVLGELERRSGRRRRQMAWSAAAALLLIGTGFGWRSLHPEAVGALRQVASATVLMPRLVALADGSVAELRDGADIEVEFSATERRIQLSRGQAYFKVAKAPHRPFVVVAGGVSVSAVGTEFSVDLGARDVEVLVTEGKVAVAAPAKSAAGGGEAEPMMVGVGEGVVVPLAPSADRARVAIIGDTEVQSRLGWRSLRLEFSGTPLLEAVAVMNRHNRLQLVIDDPALAHLRVSGIFGAANTTSFVRLLELSFDIQAEPRGDGEFLLRRKAQP